MLDVIDAERTTTAGISNTQQQREKSSRTTEQAAKPQEKSCSWMWYLGIGAALFAVVVGVSLAFYSSKDGPNPSATTHKPADITDSSHHHVMSQNLSSNHEGK